MQGIEVVSLFRQQAFMPMPLACIVGSEIGVHVSTTSVIALPSTNGGIPAR